MEDRNAKPGVKKSRLYVGKGQHSPGATHLIGNLILSAPKLSRNNEDKL